MLHGMWGRLSEITPSLLAVDPHKKQKTNQKNKGNFIWCCVLCGGFLGLLVPRGCEIRGKGERERESALYYTHVYSKGIKTRHCSPCECSDIVSRSHCHSLFTSTLSSGV